MHLGTLTLRVLTLTIIPLVITGVVFLTLVTTTQGAFVHRALASIVLCYAAIPTRSG